MHVYIIKEVSELRVKVSIGSNKGKVVVKISVLSVRAIFTIHSPGSNFGAIFEASVI